MSSKSEILSNFLKKWEHLPEQGSEEWLKQRKTTIGGSQIATVLGINKYENVKGLIKSKTNMSTFTKSAPLWFGNLMEPCIELYVEKIYKTKIFETGSLPCEFNNNLSYSPDGLCVIEKSKLKTVFSKKDFENIEKTSIHGKFDKKNILVLFEFKSPFMRKPVKNEIPEYYIPQPLLGMEIIPFVEVSIFVECVFRFCSYEDIINNNNKYSRYHWDKQRYYNNALSYSAISLYYDDKNKNQELITLLDNIYGNSQMYGNHENDISSISDRKIINSIMEDIVDKKNIKVKYHSMYLNDASQYSDEDLYYFEKYNNINKFKYEMKQIKDNIESDGKIFIGCLFYKMLDVNINPVYKKNLLTEEVTKNVTNIIKRIEEINSKDSDAEKKILVNSFTL